MAKDCIFCKISNGEISSKKIYEDDNFFVINDANPVSDGHCLIISKKHYATILDLPSVLGDSLIKTTKEQSLRLIKEKKAEGIKLVQNNFKASGQSVNHFHLHIIPEKIGITTGRI